MSKDELEVKYQLIQENLEPYVGWGDKANATYDGWEKYATPWMKDLLEKLQDILLGERLPVAVYNLKTCDSLIDFNSKVTKSRLMVIISALERLDGLALVGRTGIDDSASLKNVQIALSRYGLKIPYFSNIEGLHSYKRAKEKIKKFSSDAGIELDV